VSHQQRRYLGGAIRNQNHAEFALVGIPYDEKASWLRGAADAPNAIRNASIESKINAFTELGVNLQEDTSIIDLGNLALSGSYTKVCAKIEQQILMILDQGMIPLILGGDHSITYPVVRAFAQRYHPLDILHFDAHPDLYDTYNGDPFSHACPFARIVEEGLAEQIIQIGIRTATATQRMKAETFGVQMLEMKDWPEHIKIAFNNPVYLSFDMDALDPAFAPGVSHIEPGGLSTRQVLQLIHELDADLIGLDVVELNPTRDTSDITAAVAVKILMEVIGKIVKSRSTLTVTRNGE
jgi:agmatinase